MNDLRSAVAFIAVAERRSFSAAARSLGVTASALSQSVRGLEQRLGLPLLVRTTRSVSLTEPGRRLYERLRPALREADAALEEASGSADVVQGTLRLTLGRLTVPLVLDPVLRPLLEQHPRLSIEISVEDRFVDIVSEGFDAGVRLSEAIEPDLTAVRLTPPFRLLVAGAPDYFARRGRPERPSALLEHDCITYRMLSTGALYAWEFERRGQEQAIAVRGRITTNDGPSMLSTGLQGLGLVYLHEQALAPHVASGRLELVLEDYAVTVPGFFLYFPRLSAQQPKLRAFIDAARQHLVGLGPATSRRPTPGSTARRPKRRRR